jgi:hypothetical protein
MIARPPLVQPVESARRDVIADGLGSEDEVELTSRRRWGLVAGVVRRNVNAVAGQLGRPRLRLATIRRLRPDTDQTQRLGPIENRLVATLPISVAVLAVAAKNVEIAGRNDAVILLSA